MLACALLTFSYQYQTHAAAPRQGATGAVADGGSSPGSASPLPFAKPAPLAAGDLPARLLPLAPALAPYLPQVVCAWLVCVLILGVRLTGSLLYVQHLRTSRTRLFAPEWQTKINLLARQLAVSRPVRLLESARVHVPVTIGYFKPVILLPAGLVTGLPPAHLEAILVHELAHITRRDYLVNLFQSVLEILFFFHPAVWWVSAIVRREREYCCDDVAVGTGQDPLCYLEALTALETGRGGHSLSLAFTGPRISLLKRVERLLGRPAPQRVVSYPLLLTAWVALGLALFAACIL
ncbi:MAG: M56 family metallopeptidase, partial [Cytophagales bacterium]|nr:M56 family metallopeptidase [Cytophagales bacterium]